MNNLYDVIVVGGGGSGLAAAVSAAECGGRVLLLEKQPYLGGTTGIAVGSFTAAGTSLQRRAGIDDNPADHDVDAGKFPPAEIEARNNVALRRYFLSEAAYTMAWLESLGLSFVGPSPEPPNRVARMHNVVAGARAYIAAMQLALERRGGTIVCNAAVVGLLRDNGRVTGVRAVVDGAPREFRAPRGVVLAAGDYANAPELIAQYKAERFSAIEGINPHAAGDGHRLAAEAGGQLVNMDVTYGPELRFVAPAKAAFRDWMPAGGIAGKLISAVAQRLPKQVLRHVVKRLLVTWQHPENALFDDGAILINQQGQRFTDERAWPQREIDVARQSGKVCYILLDGRLAQRYSAWPHFISTAPDIAYAYVQDYRKLRADVTVFGHQLETVVSSREINPDVVQATLGALNRCVAGLAADPFGRQAGQHPLQHGPWVLLGPAKAYFTTTEGGAMIDQNFNVLNEAQEPIPGLYAVGQNGLGGMVLWGHGLHIAWALTSGRLVGTSLMSATPGAV